MDKDITDAFGQLAQMQDTSLAFLAADMYRAMFIHETNIHKLDNITDHILSLVMMGNDDAITDYNNYLQYLKRFNEEEYLAHKQMLEEELKAAEEDLD